MDIVRQLEYVAVSRATDTATVITDMAKVEDSPLNHEANQFSKTDEHKSSVNPKDNTINPVIQRSDNEIIKQVVGHLKSIPGIKVFGRNAMEEFLKTHNIAGLQQMVDNKAHPTFRVMRQSCSAYSLSLKYLSSLKPYALRFITFILLFIPSTLAVEI